MIDTMRAALNQVPPIETRTAFDALIADGSRNVPDKNDFIVESCRGKRVLDMGCIDHSVQTALGLGDQWLHRRIKGVAAQLVGLDILEEDARQLNRQGYDIRVANAEDFDLGETFDVIVAGDLIEHLSNIGRFLEAVARHMHRDSVFLVSTPNPFNIEQALAALLTDKINVHPQHTVWLSPQVCWELFTRHHLKIAEFHWVSTRFRFWIGTPGWRLFVNRFAVWAMRKSPLCRRDFLLVARRAV